MTARLLEARLLERATAKAAEWIAVRDSLIRQLHGEGMSSRAIAKHAGLSHAGVQKIVKRAPKD